MQNQNANEVTVKLNTAFDTLNTLEAQGAWLGKKFKAITNSDRKAITEFDLRLGNLLMTLRTEGGKQIKKARLLDCGIANIDRRRRNESEQLARNWDNPVMQELVESKRFSSASALCKEFKKLTDADKEPVVKTASDLVEKLFKDMIAFDISDAEIQAALIAKLGEAKTENTQQEAA